jgi:hypothetical protein
MTIEFKFYKESGKWYTSEKIIITTPTENLDNEIRSLISNKVINILETGGHIQLYRIFKV